MESTLDVQANAQASFLRNPFLDNNNTPTHETNKKSQNHWPNHGLRLLVQQGTIKFSQIRERTFSFLS